MGERLRSFKGLPIMDCAFFPGGDGLYGVGNAEFPIGETLVLGSNFGCVSNFVDNYGNLLIHDETEKSPTWINLRRWFESARIPLGGCFFSIVFPVLHEEKTGKNGAQKKSNKLDERLADQWLRDLNLVESFQRFYRITMATLRPRLIVALGTTHAARFLNGKGTWPEDQKERWVDARQRRTSFPKVTGKSLSRSPILSVSHERWSPICTAIPHLSDLRNLDIINQYQGEVGIVRLLNKAGLKAGIAMMRVGG
jgi:hypothetical protein